MLKMYLWTQVVKVKWLPIHIKMEVKIVSVDVNNLADHYISKTRFMNILQKEKM